MKLTDGERAAKGHIRESRKNIVESDRQKWGAAYVAEACHF